MHGFPVSDHVPYVRRYYELTFANVELFAQLYYYIINYV